MWLILDSLRSRLAFLTNPARLRTEQEAESEQVEAFKIARAMGFEYPEDAIEAVNRLMPLKSTIR